MPTIRHPSVYTLVGLYDSVCSPRARANLHAICVEVVKFPHLTCGSTGEAASSLAAGRTDTPECESASGSPAQTMAGSATTGFAPE